jgi:hypothetical protein
MNIFNYEYYYETNEIFKFNIYLEKLLKKWRLKFIFEKTRLNFNIVLVFLHSSTQFNLSVQMFCGQLPHFSSVFWQFF